MPDPIVPEPSITVLQKQIQELQEAIGLFTTAKSDMVMNPDNPLSMAQEVVTYARKLETENKHYKSLFADLAQFSDVKKYIQSRGHNLDDFESYHG